MRFITPFLGPFLELGYGLIYGFCAYQVMDDMTNGRWPFGKN